MTKDELKKKINQALNQKPSWYRLGQFIFNWVDFEYGICKEVMQRYGVDCFYEDAHIERFLEACVAVLNEKESMK